MAQRNQKPKKRPPQDTTAVPSDDFSIEVDGETYYPHLGEHIVVKRRATIGASQTIWRMAMIRSELDAVSDTPNEAEQQAEIMNRHFDAIVETLAAQIVSWDWTDEDGNPMAQPSEEAIRRYLDVWELLYLVGAVAGETQGQRGKESRPSQTTSSATA